MKFNIFLHTLDHFSGCAAFFPIGHRLELELREYGTAVDNVELYLCAGQKQGQANQKEQQQFLKLPRKNFNRNKKRLKSFVLCQTIDAAECELENRSVKRTNRVIPDILVAIANLESLVKPSDDFDFRAFQSDVESVLSRKFKSLKEMKDAEAETYRRSDEEFNEELKSNLADPACMTKWVESYEIHVSDDVAKKHKFDWVLFKNQSCCISDWYDKLLDKKYRGSTYRLFIEFADEDSKPEVQATAAFRWPFAYARFLKETDDNKREMLATALRDALVWNAKQWQQDFEPVNDAFREMKAAKFVFSGKFRKAFASPNKKLVARLEFVYSMKSLELFVVFTKFRSSKVLARESLGPCPSGTWLLARSPPTPNGTAPDSALSSRGGRGNRFSTRKN